MALLKIMTVVGAHPQFVKAAVVNRAIVEHNRVAPARHIIEQIVHRGQHYDYMMSQTFFDEMAIPRPVVNLEVGSGPHGAMLGAMLARLEQEILTLSGHTAPVQALAFRHDGQQLASCSEDGTIRIWDATPMEEPGAKIKGK